MTIITRLVIIINLRNLTPNCYSMFRYLSLLDLLRVIVTYLLFCLLLLLLPIVIIYLDVLLLYIVPFATNETDNYDSLQKPSVPLLLYDRSLLLTSMQ